jgi:aryl-alcohol dehydrogenase-like predicted oxidoreductase
VRHVALGRSGIEISTSILGCGTIGGLGSARATWGSYGQSESEARAVLDAAVELGITCIDTANSYGGGRSETVVGRWIADRGASILVTTKVGNLVEPDQQSIDLTRPHVLRQARESLERLGRPRIDLYVSHAPDDQTPIEQTLEAFAELIEAGLVGAVGACNVDHGQLRAALDASDRLGLPRYEWVQNEYSLLARGDEATVIPLCVERGLGYTPHSPLSGGILSGKYAVGAEPPPDSRVAALPTRYAEHLSADALAGVARLAEEARRREMSVSALAMAWVTSRPGVTAVVAGPRRVEHLDAVRTALEVRLDEDDQQRLGRLVAAASASM